MPLFKTFRKSIRRSKVVINGNEGSTCETTTNGDVNGTQEVPASTEVNGNENGEVICSNGTKDTPTVATETPPTSINGATKTAPLKQKESKLLVVIKDFKGSNRKEMTVSRGQVVQRQYSCGTWVNVQNVNGDSGYIPTEVCCQKEDMEDEAWCALNRVEPVNGTIYENVGPATKPKENKVTETDNHQTPSTIQQAPPTNHQTPPTIHQTPITDHRAPPTKAHPYSTSLSSTSTSLSRNSSNKSTTQTDTPHSNGGPQHVPVRKLSSGTPFGAIECNDSSSGVQRYSIEHILHPLHPLSITRSHASSDSQTTGSPTLMGRRSSLDSQPSTPAVQPLLAHNRSNSYLEAVVETRNESTPPKPPSLGLRRPSRPCDLPMLPLYSNLAQHKLDPIAGSNSGVDTAQHMLESSQTSCLLDDVFLPSEQKPLGIYEVMKSYQKQGNEEVSVSKGEFVIAMQMGYGQWASIITANNAEGLVPRGHLCRYSPLGRRSKGVSVGTQTELIILAPSGTTAEGTTTNKATPTLKALNTDIVCIRDTRPTSSHKKRCGNESAMHRAATNSSSTIYPAETAWRDDQIDSADEFWYENSMSIPRLPQNNSMFTNETPSVCTLPIMNGGVANTVRGEAPLAFHSSRESLPQFPLKNVKPVENHPKNTFSPLSIRRTLKEQSDWPISPGMLSTFSSSSPRSPQMVVLTATKDFTPDIDGTDYLSLCKGDVLHLIPGHNPYKGWLWVNHVRHRCYGYVPKTHVTNACSQELKHRNGVMMYDEV